MCSHFEKISNIKYVTMDIDIGIKKIKILK